MPKKKLPTRLDVSCVITQIMCPIGTGCSAGKEPRIEQGRLRIVAEGFAVDINQQSARFFQHALGGGGIPFGGWAEARVYIGISFCHQADLERTAHADEFMQPDAIKKA